MYLYSYCMHGGSVWVSMTLSVFLWRLPVTGCLAAEQRGTRNDLGQRRGAIEYKVVHSHSQGHRCTTPVLIVRINRQRTARQQVSHLVLVKVHYMYAETSQWYPQRWNWTASVADPFPECNVTSAGSCSIPAGLITFERMVAPDYCPYGNRTNGERPRYPR
jgi:hypothetical protein